MGCHTRYIVKAGEHNRKHRRAIEVDGELCIRGVVEESGVKACVGESPRALLVDKVEVGEVEGMGYVVDSVNLIIVVVDGEEECAAVGAGEVELGMGAVERAVM